MSSANIKVTTIGLSQVQANIKGVKGRLPHLAVPLKLARTVMSASINRNFFSSGRPNKWTPLTSSTAKQKSRKGYSPLPLIRTGRLRASISSKVMGNKLIVGTSIPYARIHQYGGTISQGARSELFGRKRYIRGSRRGKFKRGKTLIGPRHVGFGFGSRGITFGARLINIPARPFLVFQRDDLKAIERLILSYLFGRTK